MESGKRGTSGKPNDWSIQYILQHDQPISTNLAYNVLLARVSRRPDQCCFSYVFDEISQIILSFRVNISAKCLAVAMDRVIILILTIRLFWELVFEVDFQLVAGFSFSSILECF